jgi:hypothetical protein
MQQSAGVPLLYSPAAIPYCSPVRVSLVKELIESRLERHGLGVLGPVGVT